MLTNENAYTHIEQDENSPMYGVYRLQCLLKLFRMALHSRESLGPFTESDFYTLETCAEFLAEEAGEVGASFEGYFTGLEFVAVGEPKAAR